MDGIPYKKMKHRNHLQLLSMLGDINPVFALEYINYISVYGFKAKHIQALKDIKQIIVKTLKESEDRNGKDDSFVKTSNKFIERELSGKSWWQKVFNY